MLTGIPLVNIKQKGILWAYQVGKYLEIHSAVSTLKANEPILLFLQFPQFTCPSDTCSPSPFSVCFPSSPPNILCPPFTDVEIRFREAK